MEYLVEMLRPVQNLVLEPERNLFPIGAKGVHVQKQASDFLGNSLLSGRLPQFLGSLSPHKLPLEYKMKWLERALGCLATAPTWCGVVNKVWRKWFLVDNSTGPLATTTGGLSPSVNSQIPAKEPRHALKSVTIPVACACQCPSAHLSWGHCQLNTLKDLLGLWFDRSGYLLI